MPVFGFGFNFHAADGGQGLLRAANGSLLDLWFSRDVYAVSDSLTTFAGVGGTFTRASAADWLASDGVTLAPQAASNVLRRDGRGALVEQSQTNIFLNSLSPTTQTITVASGATYTVSRGAGAGTVTLSGALTGTPTQATPVTGAAGSTSLTVTVSGAVSFINVVAASFATSPIQSGASSVVRAADNLTCAVSGIAAGADWTMAGVAVMPTTPDNSSETVASLGIDVNNRWVLRRDGSGGLVLINLAAGVNRGSISRPAGASGTRFAWSARRSGGNISLSINGSALGTVAPSSMPAGAPSVLACGSNTVSSGQWNDRIERALLFAGAANDAALQSYSTLATWGG